MRRIAPLLIIALLVGAAPAAAHTDSFPLLALDAAKPRAAGPTLLPISDTYCGPAGGNPANETAGDSTLPLVKVIYAYKPSLGVPTAAQLQDRMNLIESKMRLANAAVNSESDGQREFRLDVEDGPCGRYVDIMTIPLTDAVVNFPTLKNELAPQLFPSPGLRNFIIWADDVSSGGGTADVPAPIFRDSGAAFAAVWGTRGAQNFQFTGGPNYPVLAALHEMFHNLSAVAADAPNSTGASFNHCRDEFDILCYDDGSGFPMQTVCDNPEGEDALTIDCNKNDYFNIAPQPGNYLVNGLNAADSGFFMTPPTAALTLSKGAATAGETITLDASASKSRSANPLTYKWDFDGNGVVDATTDTKTTTHAYPAGSFAARVVVSDRDGLQSAAQAALTVTAAPGPGPGPGPGPTAKPAALSSFSFSPARFRAAAKGASTAAVKKPKPAPIGATVRYRLDKASVVTFTAEQLLAGKLSGRKCVAPTRKLRKARSCTRIVAVRGSFGQAGRAGQNSFKFTGRLGNRALPAGAYNLIGTPAAAGAVKGKALRAKFTIVKK